MPNILDSFSVTYSQNREDIILAAFFPDVQEGFYVDVGANHPLYHSVTKKFYDNGWHGINFEPNPKLFEQIAQHRKRDINLMQGIGSKSGKLMLRVYHSRDGLEGISTLSESMKEGYISYASADSEKYTDLEIPIVTLKESFDANRVEHIHFMKVDVEGYEYEVLSGNDWTKYRPELLCIEANHIMKDWRPILRKARYKQVFNDGLNDYYLAEESLSRAKNFNYAEVFLLGKPVISFEIAEELRVLEQSRREYKKIIKQKDGEIAEIRTILDEITPLPKHLKRQIKARIRRK